MRFLFLPFFFKMIMYLFCLHFKYLNFNHKMCPVHLKINFHADAFGLPSLILLKYSSPLVGGIVASRYICVLFLNSASTVDYRPIIDYIIGRYSIVPPGHNIDPS